MTDEDQACTDNEIMTRKISGKDLTAGLIIMAVSIPISMGYAQIAGLPTVYGLYGSVFPDSPVCIVFDVTAVHFGVDAAPATLIRRRFLDLHIESGSKGSAGGSAGADRVCGAVASRVLRDAGGKIGQLYLGAGDGRLYHPRHLYDHHPDAGAEVSGRHSGDGRILLSLRSISRRRRGDQPAVPWRLAWLRFVIVLTAKKVIPEIPDGGAFDGSRCSDDKVSALRAWGIKTLDAVEPGLPVWSLPDFTAVPVKGRRLRSTCRWRFVIMAETLLAENNFAQKNGYRINDNQEIWHLRWAILPRR